MDKTNPKLLEPLLEAGYQLIPLHQWDTVTEHKGKKQQRGKSPLHKNWPKRPYDSAEQIGHMKNGRNVGVRLRADELVIDVDPRTFPEGENLDTDNPLARLCKDTGLEVDDYPAVRTGSGGLHIYMRKPEAIAVRDGLPDYPGVEFKSLGRQVVAPGSIHPGTKRVYEWIENEALADIDFLGVASVPDSLVELIRKPERSGNATGGGEYSTEQLARMLSALEPEDFGNHEEWLQLMLACHHATAGDGRAEFIEWSTSDIAYSDDGPSIGQRWDSLKANNENGGSRVTYRTLNNILIDHDAEQTIPRTPPEDDFDVLEVEDIEKPEIEAIKNPVDAVIADMNETFCAVLDGGTFQIFMEDFDTTFGRKVWSRMSREAFRHYYEDETLTPFGSKKLTSKADLWLSSRKRRKYRGLTMDPEGLPENSDKLNLWKGWSETPKAGDWSLMEELIGDVLCDGNSEAEEYVRHWIAYMLQKPWETPEAAIAFRGQEGTGKGTLGRVLMRISGAHGLTVSSRNQFAGRFNSHLRNCVFLFADEAFWPGDKEGEGILKQLITEPVISYEAKGKDLVSGRNMVHLMLASNEDWIVPAGKEARRFFVSDVSNRRKDDQAFFGRLWKQMGNGGYAAMIHDLMAIDLTGWRPSMSIPQTSALADQKVLSLDPASKFWLELLNQGELPFDFDADNQPINWHVEDVELGPQLKGHMVSAYDGFLKRSRIMSARATHKSLAASGRRFGLVTGKSKGSWDRVWRLPKLSDMRARFETAIGTTDLFE